MNCETMQTAPLAFGKVCHRAALRANVIEKRCEWFCVCVILIELIC